MNLKVKLQSLVSLVLFSFLSLSVFSCSSSTESQMETETWAEKLGYPEGSKVLLLHIDDAGMCDEANLASKNYFDNYEIQSAAIMVPCPSAYDAMRWAAQNPHVDVGLHLTLTSEWKTYRWPSVSPVEEVPSLIVLQHYWLWQAMHDAGLGDEADEFIADLEILRTSLGGHGDTGIRLVVDFICRVRTFGFHLATLDVRQDSAVHREAVGEALARTDFYRHLEFVNPVARRSIARCERQIYRDFRANNTRQRTLQLPDAQQFRYRHYPLRVIQSRLRARASLDW